jgi:hypothetical protein
MCWLSAFALLVSPRAHAQADASAPAQRVLFLMPDLPASLRAQLQDALEAQLSLVDAELVLRDEPDERDERELAQAERARIVLWLEVSPDGRWLLHIMDVAQERSVARRIDAREAQRGAAIEAIAVLAREASRGGPLPEQPVEPKTAEPEDVAPAEPEGSEAEQTNLPAVTPPPAEPETDSPPPGVRLGLFYTGVDFAPETSFNHGAAVSARLDWQDGLFAGVFAGWTAPVEPSGDLAVQRIPIGAGVGYRIQLVPRLWADLELGLLFDLLARSTRGTGAGRSGSLRVAASIAPRLRGEYRPWDLFGIFAGFGLDAAFTTLRYKAESAPRQPLLSPSWVRPALEAGIAFYP